jgi:phosphoesterase RecJ-like protein
VFPEGDALGSQLALYEFLKSKGKDVIMINSDDVPSRYDFMPFSGEILSFNQYKIVVENNKKSEVLFIVDCPNQERIGLVNRVVNDSIIKVNIDHHASNSYFGNINYVDASASSASQVLFELFNDLNVNITTSMAVNIYTGILIDTGGFRYDNTSARTYSILSRLLECGVEPDKIFNMLYEQWPVERFRLLSRVLETMEVKFNGKFSFMVLTDEMLKHTCSTHDLAEDFINYGMAVAGVKITAFFREDNEHIKISFRSRNGFDVNRLASKYGGGGHVKASGCRIKGHLEEVKKLILEDVKNAIDNM